jgi:heme-degrading monooxygenase HmoA
MADVITSGTWTPYPGKEEAFVAAWTEFACWASSRPGAGVLRLGRDNGAPERYVSFGGWSSERSVRDWKSAPEFQERMAQVLQHVSEFTPSELAEVASAAAGATVLAR